MTHENAADAGSTRDGLTPAKPKLPDYVREHLERKGELAELMAGHGITIESRRIPHRKDSGMDKAWSAAALHCAFEVFHNGRKVYSGEYSAGLGAAWPDTRKEFEEALKRGRRALPGLNIMLWPSDISRAWKAGWRSTKVCDSELHEVFKAGWRPDPVDIMQSLLGVTSESFADWCSTFGYDEDSRRAHATWTECRELDRVCRAMFGKDFDNAQRIAWEF